MPNNTRNIEYIGNLFYFEVMNRSMENKLCMITRASSGIGKETAIQLAKKGAKIVLVTRNELKGYETLHDIAKETNTRNHHVIAADLSDFKSIRNCVKIFDANFDHLDVLINNAGIFVTKRQLTKEGIELQFAVNHLAPFLLTHLLINKLKKSISSRVINVNSMSHFFGRIRFNDLFFERKYEGLRAYEQSKLANLLFTYKMAEILKGSRITINAADPGRVNTAIGSKNATGIYKFLWMANKPILSGLATGAATSVYLASSSNVNGVTGRYFYKCREKSSSHRSYDKALSNKVWKISSDLTGVHKSPNEN